MPRALAALLLLAAAGCGGSAPPIAPDPIDLYAVSSVTVRILESQPPQVMADVVYAPQTACDRLGPIQQRREGRRVEVILPRVPPAPGTACIAILPAPVSLPVLLAGPFTPGDYAVRVNGVEARFHVD